MMIFLLGFMGSGKTHWGRVWAAKNALDLYDLDEIIEQQEKKTIADIFENDGEDQFRKIETEVLKTFSQKNNCIIACGGGTPCFADNMKWMNEHGTTLYLSASPQYIYDRVLEEKDKRPLIKRLNKAELVFFIEQKLKERKYFYTQAHFILPVEQLNTDSLKGILNS